MKNNKGKLKEPLGAAACDLRSAVLREACVTIAVLAEMMVSCIIYYTI